MKKISSGKLLSIKGGGCNRWLRRAGRANDDEIRDAYIRAFNACIDEKYG